MYDIMIINKFTVLQNYSFGQNLKEITDGLHRHTHTCTYCIIYDTVLVQYIE